MTHHTKAHDMSAEVAACTECATACVETLRHCLAMGGDHVAPDHVSLMQTCAEICVTSANAMARGTPGHRDICRACAEICGRCAASCEQFPDDEHMAACAKACRRSEASCRAMASG